LVSVYIATKHGSYQMCGGAVLADAASISVE